MNTKHTPGPWKVKRSTHFIDGKLTEYFWVGFGIIGDETPVITKTLKENEANARLIAAAPDMLQALQTLLILSKKIDTHEPDTIGALAQIEELLKFMIAKAEGSNK